MFTYCMIMAGSEYLPNIERVGLKVAIKHFGNYKDFEGVLKFLREHKVHKDRVPVAYEMQAK
jgi:5'-3' exonuclease